MKKGEEILLELQSMIKTKTKKPISFWVFQNNAKGERNRKLNGWNSPNLGRDGHPGTGGSKTNLKPARRKRAITYKEIPISRFFGRNLTGEARVG